MLQHQVNQCPLYYLSSACLLEVKNKRNFEASSSESGRGRLQEVVA